MSFATKIQKAPTPAELQAQAAKATQMAPGSTAAVGAASRFLTAGISASGGALRFSRQNAQMLSQSLMTQYQNVPSRLRPDLELLPQLFMAGANYKPSVFHANRGDVITRQGQITQEYRNALFDATARADMKDYQLQSKSANGYRINQVTADALGLTQTNAGARLQKLADIHSEASKRGLKETDRTELIYQMGANAYDPRFFKLMDQDPKDAQINYQSELGYIDASDAVNTAAQQEREALAKVRFCEDDLTTEAVKELELNIPSAQTGFPQCDIKSDMLPAAPNSLNTVNASGNYGIEDYARIDEVLRDQTNLAASLAELEAGNQYFSKIAQDSLRRDEALYRVATSQTRASFETEKQAELRLNRTSFIDAQPDANVQLENQYLANTARNLTDPEWQKRRTDILTQKDRAKNATPLYGFQNTKTVYAEPPSKQTIVYDSLNGLPSKVPTFTPSTLGPEDAHQPSFLPRQKYSQALQASRTVIQPVSLQSRRPLKRRR